MGLIISPTDLAILVLLAMLWLAWVYLVGVSYYWWVVRGGR